MKILHIIIFVSIITINQSCKDIIFDNNIHLSSDTLFTQKDYSINIQVEDEFKDVYGQLFFKSANTPHYFYEVVKFKRKKNNYYEAKFHIDVDSYYLKIDISDGKSILKKYQTFETFIYRNTGTYFKQSLYQFLLGSDKISYLKLFNLTRELYPDDFGIYLIKWYFEGTNNIADKNALKKDIENIIDLAQNDGDYFLTLSIAYKLLNNEKEFLKFFSVAATMKCNILNNDLTCKILNDVLSTGVKHSIDKNKYKDLIIKLIKNNTNSYFTTIRFNSIISDDISDINLINEVLKNNNFHYYNLLLKKYKMLVNNYLYDSLVTIKEIENEFEHAYKHIPETFFKNKNYNFTMIPYKQIFYELKYLRFMGQKDYSAAIQTILDQNKVYDKNEIGLISSNYERISDIYLEKLYNLDSSLIYLINALQLVEKDNKILKKIENIKNNYFYSNLDLKTWIDSIRTNMMKNNKSFGSIKKDGSNISNYIIIDGGRRINLQNPQKNTVLFFYSTTCGPCNTVFREIKKNIEWISDKKINLIYISSEDKKVINKFMEKINLNFDYVLNSQEMKDLFNVTSEPVLVYISKYGKILNYQNGVSEEWLLTEEFMKFFNVQ